MGTAAGVTVYGLDEARSQAVADAVFSEWERLDRTYSWYAPGSRLSEVNRRAAREWVVLDDEFYGLVARALELHRSTKGRFDVTFSPLWELWGRCAKAGRLPRPDELAAARRRVGSRRVLLDPRRRAVRLRGGVSLNLGGLVKDHALRRGREVLEREAPATPVLLDLGGDILAHNPKRPAWQVGVKHPLRPGGLLGALRLPDGGAVLTSGSYERFVEIGGKRYCHILDPDTGRPLEGFASLTVSLPDIREEHPPSLALALLGREAALAWAASRPGARAVWADLDGKVMTASGAGGRASWSLSAGAPR